ncbi:hypothetical protein [Nocardioides sp. LHG3406-4]|uniref:hypothetical protein n=1 Tax=Nocardioides sp. LHG3406-4 TaxID=2804575 RepID=UPI003CE6A315
MTQVPRWSHESLDRLPHTTARIESVTSESGATILGLQFPDQAAVELQVDELPDEHAARRELGPDVRPMSVLVTTGVGRELSFSVLASTSTGPIRVPVEARTALWLLGSGTHGVVRADH